jgi:hypothetical protein
LPEGSGGRFKYALNNMMGVLAVVAKNVQIECAVRGDRSPKLLGQGRVKCPENLAWNHSLPNTEWSAAQVYCRGDEHLVHWDRGASVSPNARLVSQGLAEGFAKADSHIFHCMMGVYVQIPLGFQSQIDQAMLGQQGKHVIKKADASADLCPAFAIEIDSQVNSSFGRFALYGCGSRHK